MTMVRTPSTDGFKARPVGKRPRGRPRNAWKTDVEQAIKDRGGTWAEGKNVAQDRIQ